MDTDLKAAIEKFLHVTSTDEMSEEDRIERLIVSLDQLALLYHDVQYNHDDGAYPQPPPGKNYTECYARVGKLFPSLGFYNTALDISEKIADTSLGVGDAIDDIVDIKGEMQETIWRYENTSEDDALRHFKTLFLHWGSHLRSLQVYLHYRHKWRAINVGFC